MATLSIVNNLTGSMVTGKTATAKQGVSTSDFAEGYGISVTGYSVLLDGAIATATVRKLYDSAIDFPTAPLYFHFWSDGVCYLQLIGATTNLIQKQVAYVPHAFGSNMILGAANTTAIAGGAEPAVEAIAKIYVGNYSGASISYGLTIVY